MIALDGLIHDGFLPKALLCLAVSAIVGFTGGLSANVLAEKHFLSTANDGLAETIAISEQVRERVIERRMREFDYQRGYQRGQLDCSDKWLRSLERGR